MSHPERPLNQENQPERIKAIHRHLARIPVPSWNEPFDPNEVIPLPQQIASNATITLENLRTVVFSEPLRVPDSSSQENEAKLSTSTTIDSSEENALSDPRVQNQKRRRKSPHIGHTINHDGLEQVYIDRARKREPANKPFSEEELVEIFKSTVFPAEPDSENKLPAPTPEIPKMSNEPIAMDIKLAERQLPPEWLSDYDVYIALIRSVGGGQYSTSAIPNQNLQLRMAGRYSNLKFAGRTHYTEVIPLTTDGSKALLEEDDERFLSTQRYPEPESFENIPEILAQLRRNHKGAIVIPWLSILNEPSTYKNEREYARQILNFMLLTERHFGSAIISEPQNAARPIMSRVQEIFGSAHMLNTLIVNFGEESAHEGVVSFTDFMVKHMGLLKEKADYSR